MSYNGYSTKSIIKEFSDAHILADENPKLLIKDSLKHSDSCNQRMFRVALVDEAIFKIKDRDNLPQILRNFIKAAEDLPACDCLVHSSTSLMHPECLEKTHKYFETRDKLIEYGKKL
ncbi:MAG: hypothetical protein DWQ19_11350 [Crenarchaeota archaeon]|nr:MAG: hypothetical protein DWQ19_11350 [Thermoproteota archaeon]